jgi:uncharacterized protein
LKSLNCFFASDLHGKPGRYQRLFNAIQIEKPAAVFLGGDLLPSGFISTGSEESSPLNFIENILESGFQKLKSGLSTSYPRVFLILGNDDERSFEEKLVPGETKGLWNYMHNRVMEFEGYSIYGYACVPPTPFQLKDWERYDVSRFVDVGSVSPEEGWRSVPVEDNIIQFSTIQQDLDQLTSGKDLSQSIFLFHAPPYQTNLDRAALDGKSVDYVPLDVHIGSIAIKRFIEARQPLVTLHGHVHESSRITGAWQEEIGQTHAFSAALEGDGLALVRFDPVFPGAATREIL